MNAHGESSVEFADYGEILRRRWWLIVVGTVVGAGLAVGALYMLPKTYTSVALVQVKPVGSQVAVANGRTSSDLNLDTEAQIVTSNAVAARAQALLRTTTPAADLGKQVTVTVPPNTSVLSIGFEAETPGAAQTGAQAFVDAYLANRKQTATDDLKSQVDAIRSQIDDLQGQLTRSNQRLATLGKGSAAQADEQARNNSITAQIHDLNTQLIPLLGQQVNPGSVITNAQVPRYASSPNTKVLLVSGLLAGLLAGCVMAFAVDRLDRRIRGRKDLERLGLDSMAGLVSVPALRDGGSSPNYGRGAESLRQLRNALLAQMPHRSGAVVVTSASDTDAGSAVSVSLAVSMARSGADVVLLSANTVRCPVEQAFDVPVSPGLVDVLRGRADLHEAMFTIAGLPHLKVIPAGADGSLTSDVLQGPIVDSVFRQLRESANVVIADVAPTSVNADAQTLVTSTNGVVVVATVLKTKRDNVLEAVDQFKHVSARVFGSVVVRVSRERGAGAAPARPARSADIEADSSSAAEGDTVAPNADRSPVTAGRG